MCEAATDVGAAAGSVQCRITLGTPGGLCWGAPPQRGPEADGAVSRGGGWMGR